MMMMVPILRSIASRNGSFSLSGPAWSYARPLGGLGVGYGLAGIIHGDPVAEHEEARLKKLKKAHGESSEFVDLREKMWTGVSNRRATWEWLWSDREGRSIMKGMARSVSFYRNS